MLSHEIFALFYDIWLSSVPGGRDFEPRLGGMGNLNRNCQVFLAEQKCHIFLYRGVLRFKFHFREQMAQKKRSPRKSLSLILPSTKNSIDDKIKHLGGATEQNNLQKLKCLGSCLRGMLKLRIDRRISCIVPFHFVQPMSPQCLASKSLC